jgi:NAD/NADP transhydrogenase alpha subunit
VRQIGPGWASLVLSMDPGRVVIDVPSVNGGAAVLARFCRELAREASRIAAELDPGSALTTGGTS